MEHMYLVTLVWLLHDTRPHMSQVLSHGVERERELSRLLEARCLVMGVNEHERVAAFVLGGIGRQPTTTQI